MADNVIGEAFISIRANLDEFKKDAANLNKEIENTVKTAQKKMQQVGDSMTNIGKSMSLKVTAPIVAVGAASIAAFSEVDKAMDTVITKTGATGKAAEGLMVSFKNVAKTIPADMQSVGDAIGEVNTQFGLTGKALEDASAKMIKFAKINGTDVTTSTQSAKAIIEAYNLSVEDLGFVLDAVTKASQDTGLSVDKISEALQRGAPQIKAMGLNVAEAAQLLGRFEQKGIDSSRALSYLSMAQVRSAQDGKTLQEGLAELQKTLAESSSETEKLEAAAQLFGTRGATVMLDAIERGALDLADFSNAAENASGTVSTTFEATLDPIDKTTVAFNNLKLVGADIASTLQDALAPVLERVVSFLQSLVQWFDNLDPTMKTTIVTIGLVVAAIGPLLLIVGQVIKVVSSLGSVFGMLTNPIGLAVAAIGAAIAIGVLLYQNWEEIAAFLKNIWDTIAQTAISIWSGIVNFFKGIWTSITGAVTSTWQSITGFLSTTWQGINNTASNLWNGLKNTASTIWNGVKTAISTPMDSLKGLLSGVWDGITKTASSAWNGLKNTASNIFNSIKEAILRPFRNLHIPLPHFKFSTKRVSIAGISFPIPDIDIEWYKAGGIFLEPTVIGVGEAGPEAVLPLNNAVLSNLADQIIQNIPQPSYEESNFTITVPVYLDGKKIAEVTTPYVDEYLAKSYRSVSRRGGIL